MAYKDEYVPRAGGRKWATSILICIICVALNFIGSQMATALNLPLYLDSAGTIAASMMGGYLPGIIVGYFTNIVLGLVDGASFYYAIISVLIATASAFFARRGWFRSVPKALLAIVVLSLIGGALASALTWCLNEFTFEAGVSSPIAKQLLSRGIDPFAAQLLADSVVDLADKAVTVAVALVATRLLPRDLHELFDFSYWQQTPLSQEEIDAARQTKIHGLSVRGKIALIVSAVMIAVVAATSWTSYVTFSNSMVQEQEKSAKGVARLAAQVIDPDQVDGFLEQGSSAPGYDATMKELTYIRDTFSNVRYVYAYRILEDGCHVVIDTGAVDEEGSAPGEVVGFDESFSQHRDDLLAGKSIDPVISNDSYGWLLTVYQPVRDSNGKCVCYVGADILMNHVINDVYTYLAKVVSLFGAFFVLICAVVLWLAKYGIILPLNSIAHAANGFAFDTVGDRAETVEHVRRLGVRTGDEVENLYLSIRKTAEDTVSYIADAEEKNQTIARMQNNLIMVMADLVESRDQYTGDHVRKTAEYTHVIIKQMLKEGIYADQLTEDFIFDVERSAPLHDIGKIAVSDAILNKPGRFNDEEFEIMKGHTTAGREILEHAAGAVSEPTYLDEAKRIAEHHHEKWSGGGYPTGLAGEEIPLSARIMAVADVFDALVSKRSYKDGFPLEKAFAIIEEGAGTHFDPKIVEAFLHARDEAAAIARKYGDGQTDHESSEATGAAGNREPGAGTSGK